MPDPSEPQAFAVHLETDDRDALPDLVRTAFPSLDLRVGRVAPGEPVRFRHDAVGDAHVSFHRSALSVRAHATGDVAEMTVVGLRRSGAMRIEAGREALDVSRPFLSPERDLRTVSDRYEVELLAVHPAALVRAARGLTGDPAHRLRFTGTAPVSATAELYWRAAHRHVGSMLSDPGLRAEPLLRAEALRIAVRALLLTFPSSAMAVEGRRAAPAPSPAVDAAVAFIEANAHRDIDAQDVADAAGADVRALARAFRERHGRTPLQHLRDLRFDRVHRELLEADLWRPVSVRDAAARWGFASTGRFAAEYRQRYGEPPSTTLRR